MRVDRRSLIVLGVFGALVIAGASLAVAETVGLFGGHAQTERNRRAAFQDASRILARLRLPTPASLQRVVPRAKLSELEAAQNHADAGDVWTAPGSIRSVISYVTAHPPSGSKVVGGGYSGRRGQRGYSRAISFGWPSVGDVLTDRQLYVSVSADGRDRVKVLAQAESIWLTARPASERIPGRTRAIVIVVRHAHDVLKTITVSRRVRVKRIVAAFNDVPIVQPDTYSCAETIMRLRRNFSYAFRGSDGRVLARTSYEIPAGSSPWPCNTISLTINGQRQHALLGGALIVTVQRSIGIKTMT